MYLNREFIVGQFLMDNTKLHLGFRKNRLARFRKAFEPIDAGAKTVLDASVLPLCQHREPALSSLALTEP